MDNGQDIDCAVCLQKCHHPTQLPCGHIFCFLCVKGVAIQSKKCAMCRSAIPSDYLDHPVLLEKLSPEDINSDCGNDEYQWYYEGKNGWWKYDERSNSELESAFNAGDPECMLLLAGALYNVDFQNMVQVRRSDVTRKRKVRRDTPMLPSKGIAGIKKIDNRQTEPRGEDNEENSNNIPNAITQTTDGTPNNIVENNVLREEIDLDLVVANFDVITLDDEEDNPTTEET